MGRRGKPESGPVGCYHAVAAPRRGATMAPAVHAALSFSLSQVYFSQTKAAVGW
jgi:hypothetical protein